MDRSSVRVKIFGTEYSFRADSGHDNIVEAAGLVDGHMQEIARKSPDLPELRAAVLAAVNLASELLDYRRRYPDNLEQKAKELAAILNSALRD